MLPMAYGGEGRRISSAVAAELRSRIHRGEMRPHARLPAERELAELLSVSRPTLREALRELSDQGYLVTRRGTHGGAFVTSLEEPLAAWRARMRDDRQIVDSIFDLRIAIEMATARFAAARRSAGDLRHMVEALEAMRQAVEVSEYRHADSQFHGAISLATRSPRLVPSVTMLRGEIFTPVDMLGFSHDVNQDIREHQEILDAIRKRDVKSAGELMVRHIEQARTDMHRLLDEPPAETRP